ncbi:hypothetical protein BTZ20_4125 [Rhodococcus sp. MTM3W5.2]|nr:hypothetical protein BTZ20_4125 [Rhodococcus sp. MTM3W5.2]
MVFEGLDDAVLLGEWGSGISIFAKFLREILRLVVPVANSSILDDTSSQLMVHMSHRG